jgi:hypothetical protein
LGYYDLAIATTFLAFLIICVLGMFETKKPPAPSEPEK